LFIEQASGLVNAIAIIVDVLGIGQDAVGVDTNQVTGDHWIRAIVGDFELSHLGCPVAALVEHNLAFLPWDRRAHGAMVQGCQATGRQGPQCLYPLRQAR
jgi:hypothetical protein